MIFQEYDMDTGITGKEQKSYLGGKVREGELH